MRHPLLLIACVAGTLVLLIACPSLAQSSTDIPPLTWTDISTGPHAEEQVYIAYRSPKVSSYYGLVIEREPAIGEVAIFSTLSYPDGFPLSIVTLRFGGIDTEGNAHFWYREGRAPSHEHQPFLSYLGNGSGTKHHIITAAKSFFRASLLEGEVSFPIVVAIPSVFRVQVSGTPAYIAADRDERGFVRLALARELAEHWD